MHALRTSGFLEGVLKVGEEAPSFKLINQHGQNIDSQLMLARGPLVVCFTRGGWCPFCAEEAKAYTSVYKKFQESGVEVVFLTPQSFAGIKEWEHKSPAPFSILRDEGNKVGEMFGVVYTFPDKLKQLYERSFNKDIPAMNDAAEWKLPIPACFVIDTDGIVQQAEADPNYRVRPEPEETLSFVRKLEAVRS